MLELYASRACPFCTELRDELEWRGETFVEYDVDADGAARDRFFALCAGEPLVPLVVRDGTVERAGYNGRGCYIGRE